MNRTLSILSLLVLMALSVTAQNDRQLIREGNKFFRQHNYVQAETNYRKAISKNASNGIANYNLGCALQAQQKDSLAIQQYKYAAELEQNKQRKASSFYNLGTIYQNKKDYVNAIAAYKNALRANPKHDNARYNLILCMRQQKNQSQNNNQAKNNKSNKNKRNNQNKNTSHQNEKAKQNKEDSRLSKDVAEKLLDAAMQEEKETQQRLKKSMRQPSTKNIDKNW